MRVFVMMNLDDESKGKRSGWKEFVLTKREEDRRTKKGNATRKIQPKNHNQIIIIINILRRWKKRT